MKSLIDILEKLKVDDIIIEKFPIDGTGNDIITFLKNEGFTYVLCNNSINEEFNKCGCKCFYYTSSRFWFGDTSKEKNKKKNPIFLNKKKSEGWLFSVYYTMHNEIIYNVVDDRKEFLKELNKCFGW